MVTQISTIAMSSYCNLSSASILTASRSLNPVFETVSSTELVKQRAACNFF